MITAHELHLLAAYMVDTHGREALHFADLAVVELEDVGERQRAQAWRMLREIVLDMVEGRRLRNGNMLH
jgi:hypothetical protein